MVRITTVATIIPKERKRLLELPQLESKILKVHSLFLFSF